MCGIGVLVNHGNFLPEYDIRGCLERINQAQAHRGPDGEGIWVSSDGSVGLSHRRLAIVDLSVTGSQPMSTEDGKLCIVFNGEIYNYRDLRTELEARGSTFFSTSDTEVILKLYRYEGTNCVKHLRGMYAFAIWDEERQGLFIARDPFGIKPLYYTDNGKTFLAASQVKAILAAGCEDYSPEPAGHVGFFLWGYVPEPFTLYKGIHALQAGSTLWVSRKHKNLQIKSFCDIAKEICRPVGPKQPVDKNNIREIFNYALRDSVRHHMLADVPVGVFLSAGIDSTSVAALAAGSTEKPLSTLTLGFYEYKGTLSDETPLAEMVARKLNSLHITRWIRRKDFTTELDHFFSAMDQPSIDGVNTYFVSRAAAESGLKVALSGLGGDEFLGGYPSFMHIPSLMSVANVFSWLGRSFRIVTEPLIRRFTSPKYSGIFEYGNTIGGAYLLRRGLYMPWELPRILDPDLVRDGWEKLSPIFRLNRSVPQFVDPFLAISALEATCYMRNMLLRDSDWAGMAHSLEIRVPLVDLELLQKIVPLMQTPQRPDKTMMADCAWSGNVPEMLLNRPKTCFSIPVHQWLMGTPRKKGTDFRSWARIVYKKCVKEHS